MTGSTGSHAHREIVRQQVDIRSLRFTEFYFTPAGSDLDSIAALVEEAGLRVIVDQALPL
ncbi:hypothetical protein E6W39_09415 [Kitasatospora acidiphila]|uniref:Uncharacterized protein n=1 Tax=Kitasatospora acidiphila TaxID=2567942 RepID=A0A540W0C1_9ACTN|nr:hypothetical protein [Kitasatospora acidiphila]TQF02450.1 hypothetical protein E6W39_09415 [Kitasatospora acidiphila]